MSRKYEAVYIFDSTLEDAVIQEKLAKHHALLGATAEIAADHWGRRQLAYKIGRRETGYYVLARITVDPKTLPEFERSLIGERTRAGIAAAKARGVHVGRRKALTPERLAHARMLIASGESPSAVARSLEVGRSTLYRALEAT